MLVDISTAGLGPVAYVEFLNMGKQLESDVPAKIVVSFGYPRRLSE
jgi:hypothetical protein